MCTYIYIQCYRNIVLLLLFFKIWDLFFLPCVGCVIFFNPVYCVVFCFCSHFCFCSCFCFCLWICFCFCFSFGASEATLSQSFRFDRRSWRKGPPGRPSVSQPKVNFRGRSMMPHTFREPPEGKFTGSRRSNVACLLYPVVQYTRATFRGGRSHS